MDPVIVAGEVFLELGRAPAESVELAELLRIVTPACVAVDCDASSSSLSLGIFSSSQVLEVVHK